MGFLPPAGGAILADDATGRIFSRTLHQAGENLHGREGFRILERTEPRDCHVVTEESGLEPRLLDSRHELNRLGQLLYLPRR